AETTNILVNANDTNKSPWKKDPYGNNMTGIPAVRDFDLSPMRDLGAWNGIGQPPANAPVISDPDLKKITVSLSGDPANKFTVSIVYANLESDTLIRLWTDKTKTTAIPSGTVITSGGVPHDIYVEGVDPSTEMNDISVLFTYTAGNNAVKKEQTLTVTPFNVSMEIQPGRNPATATLLRNKSGQVIGLDSGQQSPVNGGDAGSDRVGATFSAFAALPGPLSGSPKFIQDVTGIDKGAPSVTLTNGMLYEENATAPLLDYVNFPGNSSPFYPSPLPPDKSVAGQLGIRSFDTPYLTQGPFDESPTGADFAGLLSSMHMSVSFTLYSVWSFADGSIYTLASEDWQVTYSADLVDGIFTPSNSPAVTVGQSEITHDDPIIVSGPTANDSSFFYPY